ncbi:rod shape-determining protein MreC [Pseudidiomarina planktonica]|uniref:Cell shape-determining protein MreC n=1 Tax=Pseudidiomarina planktonica TaxID=1323738 RepID=A0A1Y6ED31_9GAMM|nr:rod shape-determining protein MreC [Pseudidiomarina planktonica]RUO66111.1 rod shape-determining protein MreC [Pseudidiomarina planktonica]SMQ60376.1 rod shape-determining protein MreC [Pseudidiomarina planktonica]
MKSLFERGPSLRFRLILALTVTFGLMFIDHRLNAMQPVRLLLSSIVSPVQYLAILPEQLLDSASKALQTRTSLNAENEAMREQLLHLQGRLQRFQFLQNENARLRNLLDSDVRNESRRMVAEVVAVASDPFSHQLVINKGTINGVYEGQPVLDSRGIVGQIISVSTTTSRVVLISDQSHSIPLRAERNDIRVLAQGVGDLQRLELMFIPHSTELQEQDMLVTSGLGDTFPEGYPVAIIESIVRDESLPFAVVHARPFALLDRVRSVLLLWPDDSLEQPIYDAPEKADSEAETDTNDSPEEANNAND